MPKHHLLVPDLGPRRRSEGCLAEPFQSDSIKDEYEGAQSSSRLNVISGVESSLLEVLKKNYDIVSALADIETSDLGHRTTNTAAMRGPTSRIFSNSPKPLVIRPQNPNSKYCFEFENSSISSSDTDGEPAESLWTRLSKEAKWFMYDIAEAFETRYEQPAQTSTETQKLSAVALRRDLKRCYSFLHPLVEVGAALYDMLLWKNPINTLLLALTDGIQKLLAVGLVELTYPSCDLPIIFEGGDPLISEPLLLFSRCGLCGLRKVIDAHLEKYEINPQDGIQRDKLIITAMLDALYDWTACTDNDASVDVICLGFKKLLIVSHKKLCLSLAMVYSYSIVRGWTASLVLLLLWLQLSLNYLKTTKNIDIGLYFLPRKEVAMPKFDITGAQLIFDVAKIAQNLLNFAANFLEKLHSLLTWKDVHVTFVFYCLVIYWLALSMIFNTGTCLGMCGLTLGIRIFITTYLFHRFPRLRKRLDTYGWFYRNLPVKSTKEISSSLASMPNGLPALGNRSSPVPRRPLNAFGLFTSRLGSNFNLETGSQHSLLSPKHSSLLNINTLGGKGSVPYLQRNYKGSAECLSEPSLTPHARTQWNLNGAVDTLDPTAIPSASRATRAAVSPLAVITNSPVPPQDPPPCDKAEKSSDETDEDDLTESSSRLSFYSNEDEDSLQEDPMIDNVLAYRSCVMNDKERPFPKGISSGILYLTENALIYRSKSISEDRAPTIMLFTDVISIKRIQSLRTMGFLAGTRKSLEVNMGGRKKPLQFIGLAQRDNFFERIESVCARVDARIHFL